MPTEVCLTVWIVKPSIRYVADAGPAYSTCQDSPHDPPTLFDLWDHQSSFPVLLDVERPLELQMGVVVIVDELGDGLVVAAEEHARGCGFGLDFEKVS